MSAHPSPGGGLPDPFGPPNGSVGEGMLAEPFGSPAPYGGHGERAAPPWAASSHGDDTAPPWAPSSQGDNTAPPWATSSYGDDAPPSANGNRDDDTAPPWGANGPSENAGAWWPGAGPGNGSAASDPFGPGPGNRPGNGAAAQDPFGPGPAAPGAGAPWDRQGHGVFASPNGPIGTEADGHRPSDYDTAPDGDYFRGADPFQSIGAGAAGLGAADPGYRDDGATNAFAAPPWTANAPGPHPSPYGDGPPGPSHTAGYPDDFPVEDYLRPAGPPEPRQSRRTSRKVLLTVGGAVVAVILAAGAGWALIHHSPAPPVTKPSPTATPHQANINNVQTDPKPITGREIFPQGQVTEDGLRFVRAAEVVNNKCALAARGSFARALKSYGCERVVRATYVDTRKRYAVTAGVAALPSSTAAQSADHKENFRTGAWFTGLNGRHGTGAQNLSSAAGYAYDLAEGRYIIYAFATPANGASLTGGAKQERLLNSLSKSFAQMVRQPISARAGQG